jgi:hypothetical protein
MPRKKCPMKYLVLRIRQWIVACVITNKEIEIPVAEIHKYPDTSTNGLCMEAKSFINEHCSQKSMEIYKMIIMMSEDKKNNIMPMIQKNPENN